MVGDEIFNPEQTPTAIPDNEVVISVPFPYSPVQGLDDTLQFVAGPSQKIDYTAVEMPLPKKTITVRRSGQQTRLLRLENNLRKESNGLKLAENTPTLDHKLSPEVVPKSDDLASATSKFLKNATDENQRQFTLISALLEKQSAALPKLDALQKHIEQSHKVETANQRLFDVMHGELKGYKDNFLFDALQKPVIRDLLALFDDLCGQARRIARFINENMASDDKKIGWKAELQASHDNINNTVFFIIEVLNRLDVVMQDGEVAQLDLKLHKVVGVEPTHELEEKNHIARVVRPGFNWKDRVLRPTEVIIKKYSPAPSDESAES